VLLGTLYPLILDALGLGKISVGPPYFEAVFVPLMAPVVFLIGIGPIMRWKSMPLPELARLLRWAFAVSVVSAIALPFVFGRWSPLLALGFLLATWVVASCGVSLWRRLRPNESASGLWARLRSPSRSYYGMLVAHFGMAVFVAGVTLVKGYESDTEVRMGPGDTTALAGYVFRFDGVRDIKGPNFVAAHATLQVTRDGRDIAVLHPEKRLYTVQQQQMTEAAIHTRFTRDLYVALGDPLDGDVWLVRILHKPFIAWLWLGCVLMACGGGLAASDRRYRVSARASSEALPGAAAGKRAASAA
jgi:cytochrome c-type biogenesis protein CcmF